MQHTHFANPLAERNNPYSNKMQQIYSLAQSARAINAISKWPDYQMTPLHSLDQIAADTGVEKIWYKDESKRFHLKSFKALGGAYAVARQLQAQVAATTGATPSIEALLRKEFFAITSQVVFACATDGNHGRSVAWGCQMFACQCVIHIHRDVSESRKQAMEALGAQVVRISGNYDDSVRQADADAQQYNRIIVSDTSYPGYMEIPRDVASGYSLLLHESVQQMNGEIPTHVLVQAGVGGLASAVCAYFWELWGSERPRFIVVEPDNANCLQASARAGKPVTVTGDLDTLMAGLACGKVSTLAWEILKTGADDFMTIHEETIAKTMQRLSKTEPPIEAGESAVAGLAALISLRRCEQSSKALALDHSSRVYLLGTEGATDPVIYQKLLQSG